MLNPTLSSRCPWVVCCCNVGVCPQEIGGYAWHEVKNLPATREEDATPQYTANDGGRYR